MVPVTRKRVSHQNLWYVSSVRIVFSVQKYIIWSGKKHGVEDKIAKGSQHESQPRVVFQVSARSAPVGPVKTQ
jgi:hypothetical protein